MPLLTNGFNTVGDRYDHWDRHHVEFEPPPLSETDYEARADAFLGGPKPGHVLECDRVMPSGNVRRCRYDPVTNEYGVLADDGCMVTYFRPTLGKHPFATNEAYFRARC